MNIQREAGRPIGRNRIDSFAGRRIRVLHALALLVLVVPSCGIPGVVWEEEVDRLLISARGTHEPTRQIQVAVRMLDLRIDQAPDDKRAWSRLGEALAIGFARSRHASSASYAWRQAFEIDPTDCRVGVLSLRRRPAMEVSDDLNRLLEAHPDCSSALYLKALHSSSSADRLTLLQRALAHDRTAEPLVALGREELLAGKTELAKRNLGLALEAPVLFPEDWRPDGWVAVHANLGLAWADLRDGSVEDAKQHYHEFMSWFADPGPWHDLDAVEESWRDQLAQRWPEVDGRESGYAD